MVRPCKHRLVGREPAVTAFKPVGVPARELDVVELGLDELEALRLADGEGLYHDAAAERMGVSRPTFGRLVGRARAKVATALLQGKMLVFQGGPVIMEGKRRFECCDCGGTFEVERGTGRPEACPACGGSAVRRVAEECGRGGKTAGGRSRLRRQRCRADRRDQAGKVTSINRAGDSAGSGIETRNPE